MADIVLGEGEEKELAPGNHRVTELRLGRDSTLVFSGGTTIFCDSCESVAGARIVYRGNRLRDTDNHFNLWCLNASGVSALTIVGDGQPGRSYAGAGRAADGHAGRNATNPNPPKDLDGREGSKGGDGSNGALGVAGEPAVDFLLNLPLVSPGAEITVHAIGGDGGQGQDGGNGGRGGERSKSHGGKDGGAGGSGGAGGASGDAGRVFIFLVAPDEEFADRAKKNSLIESIKVRINTALGFPGKGGRGGAGGPSGRPGVIGPGNPNPGPNGSDGAPGAVGDGPRSGGSVDWARVDVLSQSVYLQYYAQQIASPYEGAS